MKKLLALLLSIMMLIGMVPLSVVLAKSSTEATFIVEAKEDTVQCGSNVTFSVYIETDVPFTRIQCGLLVPQGMEYVAKSGSLPKGLKEMLNFAEASFTESTQTLTIGNDLPYTANGRLKILEFTYRTTEGSAEGIEVGLDYLDITNSTYDTMSFAVTPAKVKVTVPVTGVTLDKKTLSLDTGSNNIANLAATVDPSKATDKTVTWKSSDEKTATVDNNGKVTAVKKGTAVITVTTNDGKFTDTCTVTVSCAHTNKTKTNAKAANCVDTGWNDYYTCDDCGQLFAANGTSQIDAIPTTAIDAKNHKNVVNHSADPATCVHEGHDAYSKCDACNVVTSGSDRKYFGEHNYGTLVTAKNEVHTENELKAPVAAHYQCSVCEKYFTENKVETTLAELTGTTPSHSHGNWVNTDANQHWKECGCGNKIEVGNHTFDNNCDTDCNICGYTRTITHSYSKEWYEDGTNHWHECTVCHKSKSNEGKHSGGTATCQAKAVCDTCKKPYGDLGNCNFIENAKAEYLKSEATCKSSAVYYKSCSVCGKKSNDTFEFGTVNINNHKGKTEVRGQKEAKCYEEGYTGDTYCLDCNQKTASGTVIPKGAHNPASTWSYDETHHWKDCQTIGCGNLIDKAEHSGGEATCKNKAVCSVCTVAYGQLNAENHKNTELRNVKAATENDKGYTGDTWCLDCNKQIATGEETDKLEHKPTKVSEKAATVTAEGNREHYYCENCGKYYSDAEGTTEITKDETVLKKLAPEIIDGKGQSVKSGEKKELTFRSNAAFADFIRVEVDGNELDTANYTIKEGSIIVTLKQDYVATLSAGQHTLGIVSVSGTAVTEFTVVAADNGSTDTPSSPQTGDQSNIAIWMILFIISSLAITVTVLRKRKVR